MDALDRTFRHLVQTVQTRYPAYLTQPFEAAELYQNILPYRHHRRELGLDTNQDYELVLLQLLSGARDYLVVNPQMRERLVSRVLNSANRLISRRGPPLSGNRHCRRTGARDRRHVAVARDDATHSGPAGSRGHDGRGEERFRHRHRSRATASSERRTPLGTERQYGDHGPTGGLQRVATPCRPDHRSTGG